MTRPIYGATLYYVTDKNIFDALNQPRVDMSTIGSLFENRNIIISKKTQREQIALYFSRLTHDLYDHRAIAARLGIISKRERITSLTIMGDIDIADVQNAVTVLKTDLEESGEVVQSARDGNDLTVNIQYSVVDYKRNEFAQIQVRDGAIEFIKTADGYIVRNTQNDYFESAVNSLIKNLEASKNKPLERIVISLFDVTSPTLRSKFFYELATKVEGYSQQDVTDVYVYKMRPDQDDESEEEDSDAAEQDTHIERVLLKGKGVTRSELLNSLLDEEQYYIVKMGWITKEILGSGYAYDIEALFTDPKACNGFSFILSSVYEYEDGKLSKRGRAPRRDEINKISKIIETKARELVAQLRSEAGVVKDGATP